jgi:Xaa-Pro aminopeptidase
MDTRVSEHRLRIQRVQDELTARGCHALLVPSSDPHLSEYLPQRWQAREWLSGFTGSMGTLVVTRDRAAVFADSRYWVQAEAELAGSGIELVKIATGASTAHVEWIVQQTPPGGVAAVDGQVLALAAAQQLRAALLAAGAQLRTDLDIVQAVWPDRPGLPAERVYEHTAPHAPVPRRDKLAQVRSAMQDRGATHHFVSTVDDIAWITNLRGSDVSYNPVFLAHLLVGLESATLFVGEGKISAMLADKLAADGITLAPYEAAGDALAALGAGLVLLVDPRRVTLGLRERVGGARVVEAINPSTLFKSRKTAAEAAHVRTAMAEDGAAMCEFYAWFEAALARGERITELTVDEHLSAARAPRRFHRPELSGHRGLQRQRRHAALPRHARLLRGDRGRRHAAHRFRGPVPRRHDRHHAGVAHRHRQRRDEARLHAGAQGHDAAVAGALPAGYVEPHARRAGTRAALGAGP